LLCLLRFTKQKEKIVNVKNELLIEVDSLIQLIEDLHDEVYSGYYSEEVDSLLIQLADKSQLIEDLITK